MPRTARIVAPGLPHHVTQRGNRRQDVFFCDEDYALYLSLMREWCGKCGVDIWAYCLMTNHVHLIAAPSDKTGLSRAIGEAHRRYTGEVNRREGWTGHLWQGRFASFVMDEPHTLQAARYVEMNPVAAKMVRKPWRYQWSSVHAHLAGKDDGLVKAGPLLELAGKDWKGFLLDQPDNDFENTLATHAASGWPLGSDGFLKQLSAKLGRETQPRPRGRPKKKRARNGMTKIYTVPVFPYTVPVFPKYILSRFFSVPVFFNRHFLPPSPKKTK